MKNEKPAETGLIAVFVPGLPDIPGWLKLSRTDQDELLQIASNVQQRRKLRSLGEFGDLMDIHRAEQLLEGKEMTLANFLSVIYPNQHPRTVSRKQEAFTELTATIPRSILKRMTELDAEVLENFDRIATATLGDIRNAVRSMPLLPVSTDKDAGKYLNELNGKLLEERKARRAKGAKPRTREAAEMMAANALIQYMRGASVKTSAEKRQFLQRVVGWAMEALAVHGTLRAGRVSLPEGVGNPVGRPRKPAGKKAA